MGVGGATWETAGTLELGSGNTFAQADADAFDDPDFAFTDEGWFVYTPTAHQEVRIRTGDVDHTGFIVFTGPDEPHKTIMPSLGYDGTGDIYWFLAGETYHLAVGNLSFLTGLTYQIIVDAYTALATTPWYSDLRDRTDNVAAYSTRETVTGLHTTMSRNAVYGIVREIDSPPLSGMECAWSHVIVGDSDVLIWEGACPATLGGVVDGVIADAPYADADYDPTHGGSAQETLYGAALHVWEVHDELGPLGVLPVPEPLDVGLSLPAWRVEYEQPKPDLRTIEYTGDDLPPLEPEDFPVFDIDITVLDTHLDPPPAKIVPSGFNSDTGNYEQWPGGGLTAVPDGLDMTLESGPDWRFLSEDNNWDHFNFPAGDTPPFVEADYLFGARLVHSNPDDGPDMERPSFLLRARFSLQASRYRFVYKPVTRPFWPRRLGPRHQATTAARGVGGRDDIQSGPRGIGGVV